jgi:three-Cys-motif partner protein
MAGLSLIEWTEATWNPVTGCSKISAGCKHCYAERMSFRLKAMGKPQYKNGFKLTLQPEMLEAPLRWRSPRTIFVNSMSDLFHEDVGLDFTKRVFDVMNRCPQHTFQVLTKRPAIAAKFGPFLDWSSNIWMGTSVEDDRVLHRMASLRQIPAQTRFLSVEPLIGPLPRLTLAGIHWVIVGGESGPGAREMKLEWVRQIRDRCAQKRVPFFFKQWGRHGTRCQHWLLSVEGARMSEYLTTVWPANPHTLAKHRILAGYLKAWMPILSRQSAARNERAKEVLFIDGFAGPGRYEGGEDGSPIIAMNVAIDHGHPFPLPVSFLFIEHDRDRFDSLVQVIENQRPRISSSANIRLLPPERGDCETVLTQLLADRQAGRRPIGPMLAFLDQFGYSDVTMGLIAQVMRNPSCEIFSYLDWRFLNAFMTDEKKWPAITRAFGDESWKACLSLHGKAREQSFLKTYSDRLRNAGNTTFVWHFAMFGEGDQLLYWLFFCTNSLRGLEEMKKAMWHVDDQGSFRFSDANNPNQLTLAIMSAADDKWLAEHLHTRFLGHSKSVGELKEYVLVDTPCHKFKECLATLEREGRVRPKAGAGKSKRKKGDFSDEAIVVEFVKRRGVQQSLL